jgi:hypothetical protein
MKHQEFKATCDGCGKHKQSRIFFRQINGKWACLCPACWRKQIDPPTTPPEFWKTAASGHYVCYRTPRGTLHLANHAKDEQMEFSVCGKPLAEAEFDGDLDPDKCEGLCTRCLGGYLKSEKLQLTAIQVWPRR